MNRDQMRGICMQFSGTLKELWGRLVGSPRAVAAGRSDQFAGRILKKRGACAQEADQQIEEFMRRNRNWWNITGR